MGNTTGAESKACLGEHAGDAGLAPALVVRVAWKVSTLPLGIHLIDREQDAKLDSDSGAEKTERLDGHSMIVLL